MLTAVRAVRYPEIFNIADNIVDVSNGNDVCDSIRFTVNNKPYHLWIDFPDPKDREDEGSYRFVLEKLEYHMLYMNDIHEADYPWSNSDSLIETDNEYELLEFIKSLH